MEDGGLVHVLFDEKRSVRQGRNLVAGVFASGMRVGFGGVVCVFRTGDGNSQCRCTPVLTPISCDVLSRNVLFTQFWEGSFPRSLAHGAVCFYEV